MRSQTREREGVLLLTNVIDSGDTLYKRGLRNACGVKEVVVLMIVYSFFYWPIDA